VSIRGAAKSMKICSLIPSGTEIVFALGIGDQVVAVTEYCNYPPEAKTKHVVSRGVIDIFHLTAGEVDKQVENLVKSGKSAYQLDTQWLEEVRPDLILTQDMCRSCDLEARDVFRVVASFDPKPQVLILNPRRMGDIFSNIKRVAKAAGIPERAEEFVSRLQSRIEKIVELVSKSSYRPGVLFLEWTDPPSPAGDWIPEQIELAGGVALLGKPGEPPVKMTWEIVANSDPDVIIIGPCSHNIQRTFREMPLLMRRDGFWNLRAVESGNLFVVNSDYFDRPGPRIINGVEVLARILHPELVDATIPPNMVVKLCNSSIRSDRMEEIAGMFRPYS
jgi:iron complex transport system substrate-binding protein